MLERFPLPQDAVLHLAAQLRVDLERLDAELVFTILLVDHQVWKHVLGRARVRLSLTLTDASVRYTLVEVPVVSGRLVIYWVRDVQIFAHLTDAVSANSLR